jgi:hypothetical protein
MLASVFLASLSVIALEILITRIFSISQWHHLSFMVISIALFGMAASGTYLSLFTSRQGRWHTFPEQSSRVDYLSFFYTISALVSFFLVKTLPLDYYKLPLQPIQALYLLIAYLSLSAPFFFTGLIISNAYISKPEKSGLIYFTNMAGSALGALIPLILLKSFGEGKLLILIALLPLIACFAFPDQTPKIPSGHAFWPRYRQHIRNGAGIALLGLCLVSVLWLHRDHPLFGIPLSDYKGLHQLMQYPDTRIVNSMTGITGRVDTARSPYLRFSPGLSLQYGHHLPPQFALFKDGDGRMICYDSESSENFLFATYSLAYAGYLLAPQHATVLIIQDGGGNAIPCALSSDQRKLTVIEKSPRFADAIGRHYQIPALSLSPAMFLSRSSQSFDVIHLENWGSSLPGTSALSVNPMFTTNAFRSYLSHLSDAGVLVLTRKLILPPSNMIRIAASAYEALQDLHIPEPANHIVILRNWDTFSLLVFKKPPHHPDAITAFATNKNFDLVWLSGNSPENVNRFNRFEKPFYAHAVQSLFRAFSQGTQDKYYRDYPLDIRPQTKDRPFPDKFFRWFKARTIHHMTGSRLYTLLLSGEIIVAIVFLEALLIAGVLLFGPLWVSRRHQNKSKFTATIHFVGIGAGYIFVELFFVYFYTSIFNDPVVSFSIVLTTVLISSSLGGLISQRLKPSLLKRMPVVAGVFLLLMIFWFEPLVAATMHLPHYVCLISTTLMMMPVGMLLGVPFPLAMRYIVETPSHRAFAWAVNGSASVLAAIVSAQIAISWGLTSLLWCAVVAYVIAGGALTGYKGLMLETE